MVFVVCIVHVYVFMCVVFVCVVCVLYIVFMCLVCVFCICMYCRFMCVYFVLCNVYRFVFLCMCIVCMCFVYALWCVYVRTCMCMIMGRIIKVEVVEQPSCSTEELKARRPFYHHLKPLKPVNQKQTFFWIISSGILSQ